MIDRELLEGVISQVLLAVSGIMVLLPSELISLGFSAYVMTGLWAYIALLAFVVFFVTGERRICASFPYNPSGDIAAILTFLVAGIGIMIYAAAPIAINYALGSTFRYFSEDVYLPTGLGAVATFAEDFFLGAALISMGGFFTSYRTHLSPSPLWLVTGIVFLIAGLLGITTIVASITYTLMTAGAVMGALCFLTCKPKRTGHWAK